MVGPYVFKTLNSDGIFVFEHRDQTSYVTHESVLDLLKVPRVASVQSSPSIRVCGFKIYNAILFSNRNSRSHQTSKLKYKHFLRPSNN